MTRLPDKHPICGHLVGAAYKGTLELTGNQTVQTDEETHNTVETAKKRTVESGTEGSLKASLTGVGASLKGYIRGKRSKSNKKSSSDIHRQSEAAAVSQTIRIESVNNLEDADRLGCQDPDCPLNDDRQKVRIVEDMRVDLDELTNTFDDKELTEKINDVLILIEPQQS